MKMQVIVWNPPNKDIVSLPLEKKLTLLRLAVEQLKFVLQQAELHVLVAPDYLFFNKERPYDEEAYGGYLEAVHALANEFPDNLLFVAGSMQWVDTQSKKLFVTALTAIQNQVVRYDKKYKAGNTEDVLGYEFAAGEISGRFKWRGLSFGIEICQDHESKTLLREGALDVHILLSYGQCGRAHNMALAPRGGLFIQCELETPQYYVETGKGDTPESKVTIVAYRTNPLGHRAPPMPNLTSQKLDACPTTSSALSFQQCIVEMPWRLQPGLEVKPPQPTVVELPQPIVVELPQPIVVAPRIRQPWQLDSEVNACKCGAKFGVFTRKHHCRQCGQIFCASCSSQTKLVVRPSAKSKAKEVESAQVRVCNDCAAQ